MSHRVEGLELLGFVFRPETGTGAWQALCTLGAGNRIPEDTGHESIGRVELFLTLPADLSLGARSTDFDLGVGFSGLLKDLVQQSWNGSGLFPGCWFPFPDTVKMKEFGGTMITRLPEDVVETDMTLKSGKEVTFCRLMLLRTEEIGALKAKPEKAEEAARLLRDVPFGQEMARPAVKI